MYPVMVAGTHYHASSRRLSSPIGELLIYLLNLGTQKGLTAAQVVIGLRPASVNLFALLIRLVSTCEKRVGPPMTSEGMSGVLG